jgi:starch phosphorylase
MVHALTPWQIRRKKNDRKSYKLSILSNLEYRLAKDQYSARPYDLFLSTAYSVLERLIERWIVTQQTYHKVKPKRVYYLSMEYLLGRSLENSLLNLGLYDTCRAALAEMGVELADLQELEADAGLGNGGLGRLAACFLDSLATLGIPAHGYGIRYDFGLFHQRIVDGRQVETPDKWLALANPWEIERPEYAFRIRFGGRVERPAGAEPRGPSRWVDGDEVLAMPFDTPVPGYGASTVNTLRLWAANSSEEFNFGHFNSGDYMAASEEKVESENITKVLYPNDQFFVGKELRLKQEYFLVSASLQDILRRFKADFADITRLPQTAAIQLNDTHPALAIPELMRILIDEEGLDWDAAWDISVRTFSYTNHTVLPEALEEWSVEMLERLLPRHMEIIYLINHYFLRDVACRYPGDLKRLRRVSLIAEEGHKRVRMAYLAVVGSHTVNGVAALHTRLLKETILRDFHEIWPQKIVNKTNGITPRRWLLQANPALAGLITGAIGDGWIRNLPELRALEPFAGDAAFRDQWLAVQQASKAPIIDLLRDEHDLIVTPDYLFDVQVKRIHEYKRQLLFALYIIAAYLRIKDNPDEPFVPRLCIFGGKAAPAYWTAKLIIRLIHGIADVVNHDSAVGDALRVAFFPNYCVSLAEKLIPAADLSEQISTAGKEASGTGNMKIALNGALTIGTLDGANIEIMEEVGPENIFTFGLNVDQVRALQAGGYVPGEYIARSPLLQRVLQLLECGFFSPSEPELFRPLYHELTTTDSFCLMADFDAYLACQHRVSAAYRDTERWTRMSILNVARCGKFSSDRTIAEYASDIWNVQGLQIETDG